MAARKTTVTHADGTVSTRKSQSRVYTHAVEVSPAPAGKYAAYLTGQAEKEEARAAKYRAAAAAGKVAIRSRGFTSPSENYHDYQATLIGTDRDIYTWCSAEGLTQDIAAVGVVHVGRYLVEYATRYAEEVERGAAKFRAQAADVLAAGGQVGAYGVVRWSSRADLAARSLGEFDYATARGSTVRVVSVDA